MLQTRSAKRTAAAAVKIAADIVDEGLITKEEALGADRAGPRRPAPARPVRPDALGPARRASPRASTPRRARPSGAPSSMPTPRSSGSARGERVVLVRVETSPDDFHGMAVAQGILTARGGATSHAAVVARQIGKPCVAGCHELVVDYATKTAHRQRRRPSPRATGSASTARPARSSSGALPTVVGAVRGPARTPDASSAGPTRSAGWRSGPTPTSPRRPPWPAATARRASACAGPSTCSARASASRSCAARSSSPTSRRGPRPRRAAGGDARRRRGRGRRHLRRRDGQARGPPAGRLRGHLPGDGRPAGRHPPDRPAAPRVPAEPRGAAGQGHPGRATGGAREEDTRAARDDQEPCTSRTRCSACAAAGSA